MNSWSSTLKKLIYKNKNLNLSINQVGDVDVKKQIKDLDELVKFNIKEINKLKKTYIEAKNSNMLTENKSLREHNKKYEEKFIKEMKKFEVFLKHTDFDSSNDDYLNNIVYCLLWLFIGSNQYSEKVWRKLH